MLKVLALCFILLRILLNTVDACDDKQSYCSGWKDSGYCETTSVYHAYMSENCKKTCGFCKVNPCDAVPCKNGGTCSQQGDSFTCQCKSGYEGNTCETVNPCYRNPCKNGGSCVRSGQSFTCNCVNGFEGSTCEKKATVPAKECKNSGKYDSQCPEWKEAGFCETSSKYYGFMTDHCSETCGFCKAECKDLETADYCAGYKDYCDHATYGSTISKNCPKTCNKCPGAELPCGEGPDKLDRVVGGADAEPNDWPWQALLKTNNKYYCGGTLVAKRWVLTAGHCLRYKTKEQLSVVLGDHIRSKAEGPEQSFTVDLIVRHPNYDSKTKDNDIALLKLNKDAVLSKKVNLACLPKEAVDLDATCYITGWGRTTGLGDTADTLQEAKLKVVTNQACSVLNTSPPVTENMLCAGYGFDFSKSQSGCQGDSGGPFVCEIGKKWYVHGAVSWGSSRCISVESYTVFARVHKFVGWIEKTIK